MAPSPFTVTSDMATWTRDAGEPVELVETPRRAGHRAQVIQLLTLVPHGLLSASSLHHAPHALMFSSSHTAGRAHSVPQKSYTAYILSSHRQTST